MTEKHVKPGFIKVIIGVLFASIAILSAVGFNSFENAKNTAEIEKLIKESVICAQTLSQLPEPFLSNNKGNVPGEIKQKMFDKITAKYDEIYSTGSDLQKRRIESLKADVLGQEKDHFRSLGGGIDKIENLVVMLDGDQATAEADISTYAKLREADGKEYKPSSTAHYKFSFINEDGRWKITKEEFEVVPGSI
ncbi:MAG: nuclear transport factor 2 family protein [Actinomycetota bacterium]|nr:nuclear transport factor 2 family protein [Actinomycetota bacterium]